MATKSATLCRFFTSPGGCWYGENCRFRHADTTAVAVKEKTPMCRFFGTIRGCRFGENCRFLHETEKKDTKTKKSYSDDEEEDLRREIKGPVTCSYCCAKFDDTETKRAFIQLCEHYETMLMEADKVHLKELRDDYRFHDPASCICNPHKNFPDGFAVLRHYSDKCKKEMKRKFNKNKSLLDMKDLHTMMVSRIAAEFAARDTGNETREIWMERMLIALGNSHSASDSDSDAECGFDEGGLMSFLSMRLAQGMMFGGMDDLDSEDGGMLGFTGDECDELLCQGIKPWDDDAYGALAAIYDY